MDGAAAPPPPTVIFARSNIAEIRGRLDATFENVPDRADNPPLNLMALARIRLSLHSRSRLLVVTYIYRTGVSI